MTTDTTIVTPDTLDRAVDFDLPFVIGDDGTFTTTRGVYAPEVYHDPNGDIEIVSDQWEALTGYTGQYSYNGAVMHPSEFIGGRLARDIIDEPDTYVVVTVEVLPEDDENDDNDPEPAGWAVLRYIGK